MTRPEKKRAEESLLQRLEKLRLNIDSLPEAHRPHLYELADTIARQHRQFQSRGSRDHGADRDRDNAD